MSTVQWAQDRKFNCFLPPGGEVWLSPNLVRSSYLWIYQILSEDPIYEYLENEFWSASNGYSGCPSSSGGGGHLKVTWRGGAHFLRVSTTRLGKKFAFWYPVSRFLDYKTMENNRGINSLLFLKTIAFCFWTNSRNPFRNFWSSFIPRSGIYAEKWYPEKRHVPYRIIWKCPPGPSSLHTAQNLQIPTRRLNMHIMIENG